MIAWAVLVVAFGCLLAFYASLLLPDEVDRGQNLYALPRRIAQFAFACGVPAAGAVALAQRTDRRTLIALAFAPFCFIGWVITFFDWSA